MEPGAPEIQDFVVIADEDLDEYDPEILPQTPQVISAIRAWLQPTDYLADSSEYNKHLHNHVVGTGLWMQKTESYRKWHDSPTQGALWVKAIAGAGKSVFAAMIAEKLARTEGVPVLSFFFRQIVATNHHPQSLARDSLTMILNDSPPLQARMKKYMDEGRNLDSITTNELWQDLVHALVSMPKVYLVIDALDEMDIDQQEFFTKLVNLGNRKPASIKLLMTSRPLPRIEAYMKDSSILQIRLEQSKVDRDIAVYVGHRLNQDKDVSLELKTAIKQAVGEKAQGSFLYARLMMDELLDHLQQMTPDLASIRRSLGWLPTSLEDMYNGMLLDHSLRSSVPQDLQLIILRWVTHSTRPLRLLELAAMIDSQTPVPIDGKKRKDTKATVRAACGPLLEILEDETVSVIHHSLTEFLIDIDRIERPSSNDQYPQFPVIDPSTTHKTMAITCLNYLSGFLKSYKLPIKNASDHGAGLPPPPMPRPVQSSLRMEQPFLDYASNNWYVHVRNSGSIDNELLCKLNEFMDPDNHNFKAWVDLVWPNGRGKSNVLPLHVSAWAGLTWYTQHLLLDAADCNCLDGRQRTPLSYASAKGYSEVVALLLEHVKDPDVDCYNGLKPIHYAAQGNHFKVVRLLLRAGVSPLTGKTKDPGRRCGNSPSSIGQTPLMYACQAGGVETVREMMPYLKPEDLNRALCWAAEAGKAQVLDLILSSHELCGDGPEYTDSALFLASGGFHFEAMRSLLKAGADPNRRCVNNGHNRMRFHTFEDHPLRNFGPTPLHALCGVMQQTRFGARADAEGLKKCFDLLFDAGSDINAVDTELKTPLHYSTLRNTRINGVSEVLSTLLLQNGADPKKCDKNGDTPLHLLKLIAGSGPLIDLFLRQGADLCARRKSDGRTPVHIMMESVHAIEIASLLPHVSDWNVQDDMGNSPLHIFLSKSYHTESGLQDLLRAGADISLKNRLGEAPHLIVRDIGRSFSKPILPALIAAGADLESRDNNGRTMLLRTIIGCSMDGTKTVQSLLELGAKLDVVDYDGKGCLHAVCRKPKSSLLVKHLVDAGADPFLVDSKGNNLIHEALDSMNADYDVLESLVTTLFELGVSPTALNYQMRTPLHLACQRTPAFAYGAKQDPFEFILGSKLGESINAADKDGIRPIHLAATLSEQFVAKLIRHGAEPTAETYERKNLLHIAARAKKVNVVGHLLECFIDMERADLINAVDDTGRSPLHYACRSGRPETVALLLQSGADPNISDKLGYTPLHACAEFEQEKLLWQSGDPTRGGTLCAAGILNSDQTRPFYSAATKNLGCTKDWTSVLTDGDSERVRDIVQMLMHHGAELMPKSKKSLDPLSYAVQCGCSEMVHELTPLVLELVDNIEPEQFLTYQYRTNATNFKSRYLVNAYQTPISENDFSMDGDNSSLCNLLLANGQYASLLKLPSMGVDFTPRSGCPDFMTTLAQHGYTNLFEKLGTSIQEAGWINGLYSSSQRFGHKTIMPYLLTAARRNLPNLDVMKVMVEVFGADVNFQNQVLVNKNSQKDDLVPGPTALHALAEGGDWWKTKAIEYLIEHGANVNLRNEYGHTPLSVAVSNNRSHQSYRRFQNAELLLKNGADPNLLDSAGGSCLSAAMHDVKLVRLLIEYGADITIGHNPVLISAIAALDVNAVGILLESGADCNRKRTSKETSLHASRQFTTRDYDHYPLHFAASSRFNHAKTKSKAIKIIKLLLANGANPHLRYDDGDFVSPGATIIHEIFRSGGIIQPFLEMAGLDLEHRDMLGRTILLAAAASSAGTNTPTASNAFGGPYHLHERRLNVQPQESAGDLPVCHTVYLLGGDLTAIDDEGNNALHILTGPNPQAIEDEFHKMILKFISAAPELVDMRNKIGNTPLHLALQGRRWWLVETLLNAGADPLRPDSKGNTPLHHLAPLMCIDNGSDEWVVWFNKFLALGVDINAKNAAGETPLFRYFGTATSVNRFDKQLDVLNLHRRLYGPFKEAGADVLVRNNMGQTLLHVIPNQAAGLFPANANGGLVVVNCFKFLMEMGVDPMAEDVNQRTALDVAAACGKKDILDLFKRENPPAGASAGSESPPQLMHIGDDSDDDW